MMLILSRIEELCIQDIAFLYCCSNPTIILIHQDANGRHVKTREISLRDREFAKVKRYIRVQRTRNALAHRDQLLLADSMEAR